MKITDAIPHRPPFLLVDEIVSFDGKTIQTRKRIDPAESFFAGHFPGNPLMPGVLICEAIAQSGALLVAHLHPGGLNDAVPVLTRIGNAKFKQMVRPGDLLEMEVTLNERLSNAFFMSGTARVGGKLAVSLDFACATVPKESPERPAQP